MGLMRRHALLTCNEIVLSSTLTVSTFGNIKSLYYLCSSMDCCMSISGRQLSGDPKIL